jgi:hypothetical protein
MIEQTHEIFVESVIKVSVAAAPMGADAISLGNRLLIR